MKGYLLGALLTDFDIRRWSYNLPAHKQRLVFHVAPAGTMSEA
ncbi:hypothetical protein [Arthrobacter ramosus]|nr:hypothetical protein [Arthrobacter ramosus]